MLSHISFLSPLQHSFLLPLSDVDLSSFGTAMFFCYHQKDKWETRRGRKPRARVLTSSPLPLSPPPPPPIPPTRLVFYPPSSCRPEWQLAASRVQWACQAKGKYLPTDLRKCTFERDSRAAALDLLLVLFSGIAWMHPAHTALPAAHGALWPSKRATARWQKAGEWIQRDGDTGSCHEINHVKQQRMERNWLS